MGEDSIKRNESDPNALHHFQFHAYIVRRGPGYGTHGGGICDLCGKYPEDAIHDYLDPIFADADAKLQARLKCA